MCGIFCETIQFIFITRTEKETIGITNKLQTKCKRQFKHYFNKLNKTEKIVARDNNAEKHFNEIGYTKLIARSNFPLHNGRVN